MFVMKRIRTNTA